MTALFRKTFAALAWLIAVNAIGHTNTTVISRMELEHPDLGYDGGAALHGKIATIYTNVGDAIDSRYFAYSSVANSTVTTVDHNFGVAFDQLRVLIYTGTHPALTRVDDPAAAGWTIAATGGFLKTKIDVTAPSSGGPHTFAVVIVNDPEDAYHFDQLAPTTTKGDLIVHNGTTNTRFAACSNGQILGYLSSTGTGLTCATTLTDPMTTRGDIIVRNSSNVTARLAVGSANTVLQSNGTDPSWSTIGSSHITDDSIVDADINSSAAIARSKIASGTASHVVINGGGGALSSEAQLSLARGGLGISSGTSGGIPYFTASSTALSSSAALTANGVVLGGGAGAAPTSTAAGTADQVFRVPGAGGAPAFGAIDLTKSAAVTNSLTVPNGGTGLSTGTSGGVPYFSTSTAISSSGVLTANGVVYGGGSGTTPASTAAGTSVQVLHGGTPPTFGAVSLTADVSGTLPIANGGTNSTATATNGGIGYGTGTAHAYTAALTSGRLIQSNGAAAPTTAAAISTDQSFTTSSLVATADGTSGAPSHSFSSDPDVGVYRAGTNSLGLAASASAEYQGVNAIFKMIDTGGVVNGDAGYFNNGFNMVTFNSAITIITFTNSSSGEGSIGLCDSSTGAGENFSKFYWACDGNSCSSAAEEKLDTTGVTLACSGSSCTFNVTDVNANQYCMAGIYYRNAPTFNLN